jgi:methionyl aminopeptidase
LQPATCNLQPATCNLQSNMAIEIKTATEIAKLRDAGKLVAEAFAMLREHVRPGVRLRDLDHLTAEFLRRHNAEPLYLGYRGSRDEQPPFPGVICASVNTEVCHGLPDKRTLRQGDIAGIDIGLRLNGYCGDACVTYAVGKVSPHAQSLMDATQECLARGIAAAQAGGFAGDIGTAIQDYAEARRFSVVREYTGHGLGRTLHGEPSVPHIRPEGGRGARLLPGMVFTIEPMINAGKPDIKLLRDGWTVVTADGALSAQFEHTIVITPNGPEILSCT